MGERQWREVTMNEETHVEVLLLVLRRRALGHDDDAAFEVPREDDLRRVHFVFLRERDDGFVPSDGSVSCSRFGVVREFRGEWKERGICGGGREGGREGEREEGNVPVGVYAVRRMPLLSQKALSSGWARYGCNLP